MSPPSTEQAVRAVEDLAREMDGRLLVVTPGGLRGSPYEPPRLDGVERVDGMLRISLGDGHAVHDLQEPVLVEVEAGRVTLTTPVLSSTLVPHSRAPQPGRVERYADAVVVLTWDPKTAESTYRTRGTYLGTVPS